MSTPDEINTTPAPRQPVVTVNIVRQKPNNHLVLEINAKPLHDELERMGARAVGDGFDNPPNCSYSILSGDTLSSRLFLRREYPVRVDLTNVFANPPTFHRLSEIAKSTTKVVDGILDHYRPIDIKITVYKKPI